MLTPQGESSGLSSLTGYGHRALAVCLAILLSAIVPRNLTAENQTDKPPGVDQAKGDEHTWQQGLFFDSHCH